ncbi:hypothetical protein Drorol1_Dr00019762 [Drosera rotundifolia]
MKNTEKKYIGERTAAREEGEGSKNTEISILTSLLGRILAIVAASENRNPKVPLRVDGLNRSTSIQIRRTPDSCRLSPTSKNVTDSRNSTIPDDLKRGQHAPRTCLHLLGILNPSLYLAQPRQRFPYHRRSNPSFVDPSFLAKPSPDAPVPFGPVQRKEKGIVSPFN